MCINIHRGGVIASAQYARVQRICRICDGPGNLLDSKRSLQVFVGIPMT